MNLSKYGFREDYDEKKRIVEQEYIEISGQRYFVSTVDLGLNHQFGEGPPLYYETMIFPEGTYRDMYCYRYTNRELAHESHEKLVADINNGKYTIVNGWFEPKDIDPNE